MVWKFSQVGVIEGQFVPREPKLVRVIKSFEKSKVREIGGEIVELEWSKSKGNKVWFEISGDSGNRGFGKSGFHCTWCDPMLLGLHEVKSVKRSWAEDQLKPSKISVTPATQHNNGWKFGAHWKKIARAVTCSLIFELSRSLALINC